MDTANNTFLDISCQEKNRLCPCTVGSAGSRRNPGEGRRRIQATGASVRVRTFLPSPSRADVSPELSRTSKTNWRTYPNLPLLASLRRTKRTCTRRAILRMISGRSSSNTRSAPALKDIHRMVYSCDPQFSQQKAIYDQNCALIVSL